MFLLTPDHINPRGDSTDVSSGFSLSVFVFLTSNAPRCFTAMTVPPEEEEEEEEDLVKLLNRLCSLCT